MTLPFHLDKQSKVGFATRTTGSFSMHANTTNIWSYWNTIWISPRALRHVISPSVGYSWTPDFSRPLFGKDLG